MGLGATCSCSDVVVPYERGRVACHRGLSQVIRWPELYGLYAALWVLWVPVGQLPRMPPWRRRVLTGGCATRLAAISLRFANGFENGSLQAARHGRKLSPAAPIGALLRESPRPRGLAWGRNYRHPYHIAKGPVQPCGDLYTGDRKPWESHVGSAFRPLPHSFTGR